MTFCCCCCHFLFSDCPSFYFWRLFLFSTFSLSFLWRRVMNRSKQAIHLKWRKEEILAHSGLSSSLFYCRIHLSLSGSFLEELAYTTVSKKDSNDCTLAVGVALSVSLFFYVYFCLCLSFNIISFSVFQYSFFHIT